nr:hypothetical protein [Tanacetum cinerariifolium]
MLLDIRFRATSASSMAICFFCSYLLLPWRFVVPVSITDIKSVLTQKGLDIFCQSYHIPDDVHPQLPSPNQTIHEMPTGKIGVYTRFFEFANFRLPLFTFLVNVLRHYRINLFQPSVITTAKVSHFEILCCVHEMDLFSFIQVADPTKSELKASVRRLFDEGGGPDQTDSAGGGGQDTSTGLVMRVKIIVAENVTAKKTKLSHKKRQAVTDASGSSHPPKKLRGDYGTSDEVATSDITVKRRRYSATVRRPRQLILTFNIFWKKLTVNRRHLIAVNRHHTVNIN